MLTNRYNNHMGFARRLGKIVLTSLVITGMMMSSCSERQGSSGESIGDKLHDAWDWLTGKPPKWQEDQAEKNAKSVANWPETLSKVNIKALPKELKQCYQTASQLSGVPLPVMYAISLNETDLDPHDNHVMANDGLEGKSWDCGIMQANSLSTTCPLAYRLTHHISVYVYNKHIGDKKYSQLLAEIQALGLKYLGGGSRGGWCNNLTHDEAVEYCRELSLSPVRMTYNVGTSRHPKYHHIKNYDLGSPLTSNPACLSVFVGAYELSYDMWHLQHDSDLHDKLIRKMIADGAYEDALNNAGQSYLDWVLVAYMYNGVVKCHGAKCYFDKFARHLHDILTGAVNIAKKLL